MEKEESQRILKTMNHIAEMMELNNISWGTALNAMSNMVLDLAIKMNIPKEHLLGKMSKGYDICAALPKEEEHE